MHHYTSITNTGQWKQGGGYKMTSNRQTYPNEFAWFSNFQLEGDSPDELHLTTASISVGLFWDLRLICASPTAVLSVE